MDAYTARTRLLIGEEGAKRLTHARVAVVGLGGVGSFAVEALARVGIGQLVLVDGDVVAKSNCNRQLIATHETIGERKAEVMARRVQSIMPSCITDLRPVFYHEGMDFLRSLHVDMVIDAIDPVREKVALIVEAHRQGIPIVSAMGTGNKCRPELLTWADIAETHTCPLARAVRKHLRAAGIFHHRVVYSTERPLTPQYRDGDERVPGSFSFVPPVAGMILASGVVRHLLGWEESK